MVKLAPVRSKAVRSQSGQFQRPTPKPISWRRAARQWIGLSRHSISAQAASWKLISNVLLFVASVGCGWGGLRFCVRQRNRSTGSHCQILWYPGAGRLSHQHVGFLVAGVSATRFVWSTFGLKTVLRLLTSRIDITSDSGIKHGSSVSIWLPEFDDWPARTRFFSALVEG